MLWHVSVFCVLNCIGVMQEALTSLGSKSNGNIKIWACAIVTRIALPQSTSYFQGRILWLKAVTAYYLYFIEAEICENNYIMQ